MSQLVVRVTQQALNMLQYMGLVTEGDEEYFLYVGGMDNIPIEAEILQEVLTLGMLYVVTISTTVGREGRSRDCFVGARIALVQFKPIDDGDAAWPLHKLFKSLSSRYGPG